MTMAGGAARGAMTTLGGQWIRFAIQLGSLAVLARILSPSDYGVVSMVTALAGVAVLIGDFGLTLASIQAQNLTHGQRSNLFWINTAVGVVIGVALILLSGPISAFFGRPELVGVTQALAGVFLLNALTSQFRAEATRRLRFTWMAVTDISAQTAAMIVAISAALGGLGYWALVLQQVAVATVTLILLIVAARWLPGLPSRREPMRDLLTFGTNTLGVQLINYASSNVDNVVLGRFWGATELGFYDRAYQLFRLPLLQIAAPMTRVALPTLSRLQNDDAKFDSYLRRAQVVLTYVMGGAFFFAAIVADPIIEIMLGPGWDPAKWLFRILAIGGIFQALGYSYYWVFLAKGKTGLQLRFSVISRSLMVVLICVGSIWGALGVAIGSSTGLLLNWVILSVFAIPRTGIDVRSVVGAAMRPITAFSIMTALLLPVALFVVNGQAPVVQLLILTAGCVVFMSLYTLLVPPVRRDMSQIMDTLRRARRG